ncbi:zinc finger MYM-type protein 1-like [Chenopodium quinoa]|uniref:zinc finger MYM-type protein 1-like n=1 Tax=Chenopodium quinoa TaxID=63459 RepID=UPI000B77F7F7|nr:zinc finger MYM-type protein 1-like [Chenopodium quinoa]
MQIKQNRLRLKASIDVICLLTSQSCPLRGHNETNNSENQGNYLEFRKVLAAYNKDVSKVIQQAPYNAKYTTPSIQKEILHIISNKVRNYIRQEIGNSKFFIIVDEAQDESKTEQLDHVLRFVYKYETIRERFFFTLIIRVFDTTAATLKRELCSVLARHNLSVENSQGQGYDGSSNMRGEWNGLQALFLSDCPYAYHVHCFAHCLQLALVAASRDVRIIHQFFSNLTFIINFIVSSPKCVDQLQSVKSDEFKRLLSIGEIDSGRGANQMSSLKRAGDTRWGSHLYSIRSLMKIIDATMLVLEHITNDKSCNSSQRGDVDVALDLMISIDFVFIARLMEEILGIANVLCQSLQQKS